jgi:hypothetical protein
VILDPEILRQVDVEPESEVEISVEDSAIVIRPCRHTDDDNARRQVARSFGIVGACWNGSRSSQDDVREQEQTSGA